MGPDGSIYYVDIGFDDQYVPNPAAIRRIRYVNGQPAARLRRGGESHVGPAAALGGVLERRLVRSGRPALELPAGRSETEPRRSTPTRSTTTRQRARTWPASRRPTARTPRCRTIWTSASAIRPSPRSRRRERQHLPRRRRHLVLGQRHGSRAGHARLRARSRGRSFSTTTTTSTRAARSTGPPRARLTIPTSGHDFPGNTRYEIVLTATDATGLTSSPSVTVYPGEGEPHLQHPAERAVRRHRRRPQADAARRRLRDRLRAHDRGAAADQRGRVRTASRAGPTAARRVTP